MKNRLSVTSRVILRLLIILLIISSLPLHVWSQPEDDKRITRASNANSSTIFLPYVANESLQPIIPDSTNVISDDTLQVLTDVSEQGVFRFTARTPELERIEVGEVIVGGVSDITPNGFLRKVTGVNVTGNQVIITTEAATIEDAIQQGELHVSRRLTPNDVAAHSMSKGIRLLSGASSDFGKKFILSIDEVIYDDDGDLSTTNDQVHAKGSISFAPNFTVDISIKDWKIQRFRMVSNVDETAELEIYAKAEMSLINKRKELYRAYFHPIVVIVGIVPVVFTPVLTVHIGVNGNVYVGVSTSVIQEADITAGVSYENQQWMPIGSITKNFDFNPPHLTAGLSIRGYTGVQFSLLLYGVTGPYTEINAFLELETNILARPWWKLYAGFDVPAGAKIEILSHKLANYQRRVISLKVLLAQAGDNLPPNTPAFPNPPDGAIDQTTEVTLFWSGGDPDGDRVTYDVYLEANDPSPDLRICSTTTEQLCEPGVLAANTQYFWKVIATDQNNTFTTGPVWSFTTADRPSSSVKIDIVLIIDSSGSMTSSDPDDMRKDAAKVFIDAMENGDQVAIVDFDTRARVLWPLQPLSSDRTSPKTAVDSIDSNGGTDLVVGLRTGYEELDSVSNSNVKAALFLTDGQDESGNSDEEILAEAAQYARRGWRVFTIGLGSEADVQLLQRIANQTGGNYYILNEANQLVQVYFDILRSATGSTDLLNTTITLAQGETETLNVTLPSGQTTANFLTSWQGSTVETTLFDPNGRRITPDIAMTDPNIYYAQTTTSELYRITNPAAGLWRIQLFGANLPTGSEEVNISVSTREPDSPIGHVVWQAEAETGLITQPLGIGHSADASACAFIYTVDDLSNGSVTFTFEVPETAYYYPWTRAMGFGWRRNSFFVSIDDQPEFHFEILPVGDIDNAVWDWKWQRLVVDRTKQYRWLLSKGVHSIRFRSREPDSRLDVVLLADRESYVPTYVKPCP